MRIEQRPEFHQRPGWMALLHRLTKIVQVARSEVDFTQGVRFEGAGMLQPGEEFLIQQWTVEFIHEPPSMFWRSSTRARLLISDRVFADVLGVERLDSYVLTPAYADPRSLEKGPLLVPAGHALEVAFDMPSLLSKEPVMRVELHGWLYRRGDL